MTADLIISCPQYDDLTHGASIIPHQSLLRSPCDRCRNPNLPMPSITDILTLSSLQAIVLGLLCLTIVLVAIALTLLLMDIFATILVVASN